MNSSVPIPFGKRKQGSFQKQRPDYLGKRPSSQLDEGSHKRRNIYKDDSAMASRNIDTIYRILCHVKNIGSVLGKGGCIVNALRDETHAKIRVADGIPGADERVIIIFSYPLSEPGVNDIDQDIGGADDTENESNNMRSHCPAQDALLKVHERISADDLQHDGVVHDNNENDVVTARLLVPDNQVGCLIGKGGSIIQKLRSDTGANIRILPAEHLPACAMRSDELVQISGAPDVVKKALYDISTLLHNHPRKENPPLEDVIAASTRGLHPHSSSIDPTLHHGNPLWSHQKPGPHEAPPVSWSRGYPNESSTYLSSGFNGGRFGNDGEMIEEFSMKIVCPAEKIGGVIGKGGANVRQLEQQTGASIRVENTPESKIRVILVSSKEAPWDRLSPTIDAILHLQGRTSEISEEGNVTTMLLVPSSKVGCLLGQGGHIITEMRRRTKAEIRVYAKDDKPEYASSSEELVQISGNQNVARDALIEVASRLRERTLKGGNAAPNFPPSGPYHGIPPQEKFFGRGLPPSTMIRAPDSSRYEHLSMKGAGLKYEGQRYSVPPTSARHPNFNSPVEYKIPDNAVPSVIGNAGNIYADSHQIPSARVRLHDPLSGASEHVVDIRGSSEQMNPAHFQAFMSSSEQNLYRMQAPRPY